MTSHTWWYMARSGGIVAWALLAVSMFWGVALSSRFLGKKPKPKRCSICTVSSGGWR